jgi:hypothetical protein
MMDLNIYTPLWYIGWFTKKFNRLYKDLIPNFTIPFTKTHIWITFSAFHLFALKINRYEFCISFLTLSLIIIMDYKPLTFKELEN